MNNKKTDLIKNILAFTFIISIIAASMYMGINILDKRNLTKVGDDDLSKSTDYNLSSSSEINNILTSSSSIESGVQNQIINQNKNTKDTNRENKNMNTAILKTNMGDITVELSTDKPKTTENFKKLISENFYDGVKFHRVIKGFMIQAGDPLSKDESKKDYWGTGGPGYKFADELTGNEKYTVGTLAMANSGPNTNGSQFFIMTSDTALPPSYTVFGKVVSGIDVAMKIQDVATDVSDKPLENVVINSIVLK